MKRLIAVFLAVAIAFLLSSCGDGSDGAIYYPLSASPATLDPQFTVNENAEIVINNCFEGLTRLDADGSVIPGVAESWTESPDGLSYVFHLREDTGWKLLKKINGKLLLDKYAEDLSDFDTRVTAYDFVFAFARAVKPETECPDIMSFYMIKNAEKIHNGELSVSELGVRADDDYTLTVELENPCVDFLERLTKTAFMPCCEEYFNMTGGRYGLGPEYLICNGPFYVSAWDPSQSLTLARNSEYKGEKEVCPSSVNFFFNSDIAKIAEKISLGTYSAGFFTNLTDAPSENVTITDIEDSVYGFCFNCADGIMENEKLRLALTKTIDRELFGMPDSMTKISSTVIPPCCYAGKINYFDSANVSCSDKPDNDGAAALWNTALTELRKTRANISLLCIERYSAPLLSQLQLWQQVFGVSIGISIETVSESELEARLNSGDYQMAFAPIHCQNSDASDYLHAFESGNVGRIFSFDYPEYTALTDSILTADDQQAVLDACYTADRFIIDHGIFYPMFICPTCFVQAEGVTGITCSLSGDNISFISAKVK